MLKSSPRSLEFHAETFFVGRKMDVNEKKVEVDPLTANWKWSFMTKLKIRS